MQKETQFGLCFKGLYILRNIYTILTLVETSLHVLAKKCSPIWSHTQYYTHTLKLFKYFMCENREVISHSQFGKSQLLNMLHRSCLTHRNWHFPCHLSVTLLFNSFTHLYKCLHWHFAKELSYKSLAGSKRRKEDN